MSLLKKMITATLIATMMLATSSLAISATAVETVEQEFSLSEDIPEEDSLPSSDELLTGYLEKDIYPDVSLFGRSAYDLLNEHEKTIYTKIKETIIKIANGEITDTSIEVKSGLDAFSWTTTELGVSTLVSGGKITAAAETAISNAIKSMISTGDIMRALISDLPCELFWFNKTQGMQTSYASSAQGSKASVTKFIFYFDVSVDFAGSADYTTNTSLISSITTAKQNAKAIVDKHADKTDIEKLTAYKEDICKLTDYYSGNVNTVSYGNPWQLVWVFDNDSSTDVVCEGYSKAFKYLCDLSEFSSTVYCYLVTGTMSTSSMSGPHMWNVVEIGGKNYLADVTNSDDGSIGYNGSLFMVGTITSNNGALNQVGNLAAYSYDTNNLGNYLEDGVFLPVSATSYSYDALRLKTVTVNEGSGGGDYSVGATVTITANPAADNQIFDGWVVMAGNVTLDDPKSETTSFTMPNSAVTVTATYHTHSFATVFSYDDENHWYDYTCGCTEKHLLASHKYKESTVKEATCTEEGTILYTCECNHSYEETTDILDHEYDDGVVTKEPSTAETGEKKYSCNNCEHFILETLEKLPEAQGDSNNGSAPPKEDSPNENNPSKPSADKDSNSSEIPGDHPETDTDNKRVKADIDEDGCGASLGTSAISCVALLGCAIAFRKKKDD